MITLFNLLQKTVFVEGKGVREVSDVDGNALSVQNRDISRYKTTNIIVMLLTEMIILQNDLFSFALLNDSFHGQRYSTTYLYQCDCT